MKVRFTPSSLSRGPEDLQRSVTHQITGGLDSNPICRVSESVRFYLAGLKPQRGPDNGRLRGKEQPASRRAKEGLRQ